MMRRSPSSCLHALVIAASLARCVIGSGSDSSSIKAKPLPNGDADCDCFLTNGTAPGYYAKHMFFDFRNLSSDAGVPKIVVNETEATIAPPTSKYFTSEEWTSVWQLQGWSNSEGKGKGLSGAASVLMAYSPGNVYIEKNNDTAANSETYMSLRTQRLPKFQSAAAFQTKAQNFRFLSLRMLSRTIGGPGAVTAMFTYHDPNGTSSGIQESDFEVLTRGPREKIQYTNQPSVNPDGTTNQDSTKNVTLPNGIIWSQWAVHRLDWTPARSVWYVNGQEASSIDVQVPQNGSGINFNAWSDGGVWSGNMSAYDEANLQIQWIEIVYNTSSGEDYSANTKRSANQLWNRNLGPRGELFKRAGSDNGECKVVCSIDETNVTGNATELYNSTAIRTAGSDAGGRIALMWTLLVGGIVWLWVL